MRDLNSITAIPAGTFVLLCAAALLEVVGDSFFQSAMHRSSGWYRIGFLAAGAVSLVLYGVGVNLPRWDFGKLLGVYVVFFFVAAQVVARVRFHQAVTLPMIVGGSFIFVGGMIISFWNR